jgi:hypothetical protein
MDVGPEMDAEVARVVFGHEVHLLEGDDVRERGRTLQDSEQRNGIWQGLRRYSSSIAAAWTVVEWFDSYSLDWNPADKRHQCKLVKYDPEAFVFAVGKTAPEAICRAALAALEVASNASKS